MISTDVLMFLDDPQAVSPARICVCGWGVRVKLEVSKEYMVVGLKKIPGLYYKCWYLCIHIEELQHKF